MPQPEHNSWLASDQGNIIDLLNPDPGQISIQDIADGLSKVCRFNGQIKEFYSVAQHSMHVAELVPDQFKLQALLHDASEAYICDVPTPFKRMLGDAYSIVEQRLMVTIGQALDCDLSELHPTVKQADRIMVVSERDALQTVPMKWSPEYEDVPRYPNFCPKTNYTTGQIARQFVDCYRRYKELPR